MFYKNVLASIEIGFIEKGGLCPGSPHHPAATPLTASSMCVVGVMI